MGFMLGVGTCLLIALVTAPAAPDAGDEPEEPAQVTERVASQVAAQIDPVLIPGRISVTTTPSGAECWVDDERHGTTPCEIGPLPAGRHYVELRLADHHPKRLPVDVMPGRTISVSATLRSTRMVAMELNPDPTEAKIYLDGRAVGSGSQVIAVSPGHHEVRLQLEGYDELRRSFEARVGPMTSIDLEMRPTGAMAQVLSVERGLMWGIIFSSVAVVAAGFAAWQGIEARDALARMQALPPGSAEIETTRSYGNTSAAVADGFIVGSGVSLAVATAFFLSLAF